MTAKPETALQSRIRRAILREHPGSVVWKIHGSAFQVAGIPDLVACVNGRFVGLEVKLPDTILTVTRRQARALSEIRRAGGVATVVTSPEEALKVLGLCEAHYEAKREETP